MSMNFDINLNRLKTDYSSLFSGMTGGGSSSVGMAGLLGDYASIKNGSYGRLMKAYYSETGSSGSASKGSSKTRRGGITAEDLIAEKIEREKARRVESEESKAYTKVKSATDNLTKAMDKFSKTGSGSLFEEKLITTTDEEGVESTKFDYDRDAIYNAVKDFVSSYNSVLKTAGSVGHYSISNRVSGMQKDTQTNEKLLNQLGITINADKTLSINKESFMKADMRKVQDLLGGESSYAQSLSEAASLIKYNANYEQLRGNTYTYDGTFDSAYNSGQTFNSSL